MIGRIFKQSEDQMDKNLLEINFTLGKSISKGIPWKEFSEVEIQGILKIHFERLGFKVIWRHIEDPANEDGVDLECIHKKNLQTVIIAVKKKPKKNDLGQVLQLSQSNADRRVYLYLNGATQSFRNQIMTFESKIEFWDEKRLEEILDESGLAIWLKIDNSFAIQAINSINKNLFTLIKSSSRKPFPKSNSAILKTLWDLKDRAVTLNKCATLAQLTFEDSKRFGQISYQKIQDLQLWYLDYLYVHSLFSLSNAFEYLSNDLKTILAHTYDRTKVRSNWFMLDSIKPGFIPKNIEFIIQHDIPNDNTNNEPSNLETLKENFDNPGLNKTYFQEAAREFRCIGVWADGLEGTIDYLFQEYLSERIQ